MAVISNAEIKDYSLLESLTQSRDLLPIYIENAHFALTR